MGGDSLIRSLHAILECYKGNKPLYSLCSLLSKENSSAVLNQIQIIVSIRIKPNLVILFFHVLGSLDLLDLDLVSDKSLVRIPEESDSTYMSFSLSELAILMGYFK